MGNFPGYHDVPSADSADNNSIRDVIGSKLDTHDGDSVRAVLHTLDEHAHKNQSTYPDLGDSITVTSAAGAWTYGAWVEIVPVSTITSDYDVHWVNINSISDNDEFQIQLGKGSGGAETPLSSATFEKTAVFSQEGDHPIQTEIIAANTRLAVRLACKAGGAKTIKIKIHYHTY